MSRFLRPLLLLGAIAVWLMLPSLLPGLGAVLLLVPLYVPIVVGLSLLSGFTGQVSLGQAAFYGSGAYVCAIFTTTLGWNPWLGILAATIVTMAIAGIVGAPLLVLRGHYLVIGTLALNVIAVVVFREWRGVTGGPNGLSGVPQLTVAGVGGDDLYFLLATTLALLALWSSRNLVRSRAGRALQAIASSETAAETLAVASISFKIRIFMWAGALAGASGALYAQYLRYVSPSPFGVGFSVLLLVMAVLGGISSVGGAVLGTALVLLVREQFRDLVPLIAGGAAPEYEVVLFGLLLAASVIFVPSGLWPWILARLPRHFAPHHRSDESEPEGDVAIGADLLSPTERDGPVIETSELSKHFGGLAAVEDVTLEVRSGEVFAVIGPNGAGKTTLLNLMSGVLKPSAGRLAIVGQDVTRWSPHRVAELGVARTFQKPDLFPLLDAIDNVKVGLHRHLAGGLATGALHLTAAEERRAHSTAMRSLELVGIAHLAHEPVDALPFGSQRLVELARALATDPEVLLLDEPASGLNRSERLGLGAIIEQIRSAGISVVLVEHDVPFVMSLADRVLVLHHGKQIAFGPPNEIRNEPAVVEAYLGSDESRTRRRPSATVSGERGGERAAGDRLLEVDGVEARYGAVKALHGVDLRVARGEVVAVVGRNGAGKSTLMRCVSGLLSPTNGSIRIDGQDITREPPEQISRLGVSLVPERRELFWTMTTAEHLGLGAYTQRRNRTDVEGELELVHRLFPILADRRSQRANSMSGGQQQMLAFARSLMARPRLLLLDEPTLGLAPKIVDDILETLEELLTEREDLGVLIVEQNTAVLPIVDRVYVMEDGRFVLNGATDEVRDDPAMQAAFLGESVDARPLEYPKMQDPEMQDPEMDGDRV